MVNGTRVIPSHRHTAGPAAGKTQYGWALPPLVLNLVVLTALWFAVGVLLIVVGGVWSWLAGFAAVVASGALFLLQRQTGESGQRKYLQALEAANAEHANLRRLIEDDAGHDELQEQINRIITRMSKVLQLLLDNNIQIALASAHARRLGVKSQSNAGRQAELSDLISESSEETSRALSELAQRTTGIADANSGNLEVAKQSLVAMGQVMAHIESSAAVMGDFSETVERLVRSSENIRNILDTVQGFAAQTNMLALNAAIEAARAGEHGRGFAVVADEVRALAGKVGSAADQISELVEEMGTVVTQTADNTDTAADSTDEAKEAITTTLDEFQQMVSKFEHTHEDLLMVSSTVEELSHSNEEGLERTKEIRSLGEAIRENMQETFTHADVMRDTTNVALQTLARYRLQQSPIEPLVDKLLERRDIIQSKMEELANEGVDLFDRNYQPVPGSKMDKYEVSWREPLRRKLQSYIDQWHEGALERGIIYWLPTDDRGYTALNRSDHSQPETGDARYDFVHSRYMYFSVDNDVELNNLHQCKDVSMGTFVLPGGQTVITIFTPITVHGRRWGVFSVGALPKALHELGGTH